MPVTELRLRSFLLGSLFAHPQPPEFGLLRPALSLLAYSIKLPQVNFLSMQWLDRP
jgi:hypothetical protein